MAYSPHNTIPPHILDAAIRAYVQTAEPVSDICARLKISHATLHRERRARGLPLRSWRPPGRPRRKEGRADVYALAPRTPKQQRVWDARQAEPHAPPTRLAQLSEASLPYVSRLVGHWQALEEADHA